MTQIFGIVGDPIDQVRSPSVFNGLFRERKVDAIMVPMHVRPDSLAKTLEGLRGLENLSGIIITVPHKIAVASLATRLSERAKIAGSVNVLRRCVAGWEGDLFDGEGFALGMEAAGHHLRGKSCGLVGCGGAGAAIAVALLERRVSALALWDSDQNRSHALRERLTHLGKFEISIRLPNRTDDIAINATPLGMAASDALPFQVDDLRKSTVVADVIMKPPRTKLLECAATRGLATQEGRYMLDSQVEQIWQYFLRPTVIAI